VLDQAGVGRLIDFAVDRGRAVRPNLKVGICGEHGGEPRSVKFCHRIGLDYVSCSPYRVPIARLAAAQAALEQSAGSGARASLGDGRRTRAREDAHGDAPVRQPVA
jgi:phosphoenolpyruvate-protein kinase (PTS system EI component)